MSTRASLLPWAALLTLAPAMSGSVPQPADWVPIRWPWTDLQSLELLKNNPVNCLLLKDYSASFDTAAAERGIATLAVISPGGDTLAEARKAIAAKVTGIVLEGDFAESPAAAVREAAHGAPVIELTARNRMPLGAKAAILGTYQGVWPGVPMDEDGAKKAGPSGSAWIDTNTGFIRAVRAWSNPTLWIANQPPARTVVTTERYLQVIADAAASGARWVIALDPDFSGRLKQGEPKAVDGWKRINNLLRYFEQHPEWRGYPEYGKLAVVQDPAKGGLLSGGILDMIAVKHTPVRPVPVEHLTPEALEGASMAVDVDAASLTPVQKEILRNFARKGGALLTGPPGWKDEAPNGTNITLDKAQLDRLSDIWRDVNSMVGRRNLGVRLFNVSSMLSNVLTSPDGKTEIIHLVNYSDYPVETVTVHYLGNFKRATLLTPEGEAKTLEIYPTEDGSGVDIDRVSVCATIKLEQ
jgi:hypothetical protein